MKKPAFIATCLWLVVNTVGCAPSFQAPIGSFQTGVNTTVSAVRPYFAEMNSNEIKLKLYSDVEGGTPWSLADLQNPYPADAIAVRLKALQIISDYANLLGKLANSSASADLTKAATSLGTNAQSLNMDISKLADKNSVPDLSKPITSIVNLIGQGVIAQMQNDALKAAITNAAPDIDILIDLLHNDLDNAIVNRREAFEGMRAVRLKLYNAARDKATPDEINAMIGDMIDDNDHATKLETIDPGSLFADMKKAHADLVAYATGSQNAHTPESLAQITDDINVFVSHAQLVANAVNAVTSMK